MIRLQDCTVWDEKVQDRRAYEDSQNKVKDIQQDLPEMPGICFTDLLDLDRGPAPWWGYKRNKWSNVEQTGEIRLDRAIKGKWLCCGCASRTGS